MNAADVAKRQVQGRQAHEGDQAEARTRSVELLSNLGLAGRLNFLPPNLSGGGGEKQRVAVARALVNNPLLILSDEPTANLDSKSGQHVIRLLAELAEEEGRSVLIVSHDHRIRDIAHRVLWMEDGRLWAE